MASLQSIKTWDLELDVAVVGFGIAGCVAAVEAVETRTDAKVAIFEKATEARCGGNSRVSGQALWIARPDQLEAVIAYQRKLNQPNPISEELLRTWAQALVELEPWIQAKAAEVGGDYSEGMGWTDLKTIVEFPELGAEEAIAYNSTIKPNPSGVWRTFRDHVLRRPEIALHYESPVVDLIQDPDSGEIFGVIVEQNGRRLAVRARGGVILACGGYEANAEMQRNYWGADRILPLGSPANTGDGVRMLQKAGAKLWHMRNFTQSSGNWPAIKVDGYDAAFLRAVVMPDGGWMEIGADHKRFYDEGYHHRLRHYHQDENGRWQDAPHWRTLPVHMIFDETTRTAGPIITSLMTWNTVVEGYEWSADNSAEVEKGWIVKADTIEELARLIGRPEAALVEALRAYNAAAQGELPCPFGRDTASMRPLQGPFYAAELVPGVICSTGGGERNGKAQVIGQDGAPITGLYEAGELGSIFSNLYQNGAFLTEAMIFGRIAGREAALR